MSWNFLLAFTLTVAERLGRVTSELNQFGDAEYIPGTSTTRIIISVSHGGPIKAEDIPDRDAGCWSEFNDRCIWSHSCGSKDWNRCRATTTKDVYTLELSLLLHSELRRLTGTTPHMIINRLHRSKMDANRDVAEAAFDVASARHVWWKYHDFLSRARSAVNHCGPGLLVDMHGHSHPENWVELGYLLSRDDLKSEKLSSTYKYSSIRNLASLRRRSIPFEELVRGPTSFGGLLAEYGHVVVPSPGCPDPGEGHYLKGGYIIQTYGSMSNGRVDAIQIEFSRSLRKRDTASKFAEDFANTIFRFMKIHYGYNFTSVSDRAAGNETDLAASACGDDSNESVWADSACSAQDSRSGLLAAALLFTLTFVSSYA